MRQYLHSKIHQAIITQADINYIGSITIDENLLEKTDLKANEKVVITSLETGQYWETYVVIGKRNSGIISMNGSCAHKFKIGEKIIIMGYEFTDTQITNPKVILVNDKNEFVEYLDK